LKIINFGSINYDKIYQVEHFAAPGETVQAKGVSLSYGGKGLNQSIAAARAGAQVIHAGTIGADGQLLEDAMRAEGVDVSCLLHVDGEQGHALIQVDEDGENCIIVHRGSNLRVTEQYIDEVLSQLEPPAYVIMQNELPHTDYIIRRAHDKGFSVVLNASPVNQMIREKVDFNCLDWIIINEHEGEMLTAVTAPEKMLDVFEERYPDLNILLTLGKEGSVCLSKKDRIRCGSYEVPTVDTTGAGDTYTGYFLATYIKTGSVYEAMKRAALAAALSVMKAGAEPSIPTAKQVDNAQGKYTITPEWERG